MSKIITLIRHAESSWNHPGTSDFERPLNSQGRHDAPMMGQRLAECEFQPSLILASSAQRTRETAEAIAQEIKYPCDQIALESEIYEASLDKLMEVVHKLDDNHHNVVLIGHNPGLSSLCNYLSNGPLVGHLPPCGIWQMSFDTTSWQQVEHKSGTVLLFETPGEMSQ